jgi:hypothetical protein
VGLILAARKSLSRVRASDVVHFGDSLTGCSVDM